MISPAEVDVQWRENRIVDVFPLMASSSPLAKPPSSSLYISIQLLRDGLALEIKRNR